MSKKAVVVILAVWAAFIAAEELSLKNETAPSNKTILKRADVVPKNDGFMSKLASWIFPFGGSDSVASETQHGGRQYLPPSQNLEGQQNQDCNPCNKEPWIPVATNYGKNTIIGFMHPSEFVQGQVHHQSLDQLRPPLINGQSYGVPSQSYGAPVQNHGPTKQNENIESLSQSYEVPNNFGSPGHNLGLAAETYGLPNNPILVESYGPPVQNLKPPVENYGPPYHPISADNFRPNSAFSTASYESPNNAIPVENYGPPVPNLKPLINNYGPQNLKPPVENFGPPEKIHNFGLPATNNIPGIYGHPAPVENFGPIPATYGPPEKTYGIPQPQPLPTFAPPIKNYGPPLPGPPKPFLNPPKHYFGPTKTHNIQKPRHVYGGPKEQQAPSQYANQYRPPPPKFNAQKFKQVPKFANFGPTLATNMRPPPFNPQNIIPLHPQNNVKFPNPDYMPPRVQLPLSQNHPAHLLKPIPLPNLSAYPVVPLHGPQDFRKGGQFETSTISYNIADSPNSYNLGDGYTNQQSNNYISNGGGDVQIQQSIAVADYLASVEHPISVIRSPILEVNVANTSSQSDYSEEVYRDLSNQPTNEYGVRPDISHNSIKPENSENSNPVTVQPGSVYRPNSITEQPFSTVTSQPENYHDFNTAAPVQSDKYSSPASQGNFYNTANVQSYDTTNSPYNTNVNFAGPNKANNAGNQKGFDNINYYNPKNKESVKYNPSEASIYNPSSGQSQHIEKQPINIHNEEHPSNYNNNLPPQEGFIETSQNNAKHASQQYSDSYSTQAQPNNFVTSHGDNINNEQPINKQENPKYYNNLNNEYKLSQNPIIVDDTHTAESRVNGTIQNQNNLNENKTYHTGAAVNADLINQIIKGVDFKEASQFTKPELDYSDWLPNQELSTEMVPPPEGESFWLTSIGQLGVEVTTKKPKQIQIIIPYTTNVNNPKIYDKNLGRKVGPNALPLHTQPPSFESVWSEHNGNQIYKTSPSHDIYRTGLSTNINKPTTPVINIKDLLKANQAEVNYKNLPFDIIRFQKNIDDWTEQEFAHKMLLNFQTTTTRLVASKKIPDEYLTTQPYNPREFEVTTYSPRDFFDHEPAGTNSKEYKYKDEYDGNSNIKEHKIDNGKENSANSKKYEFKEELEHNYIGADSTVGVDVTTERKKIKPSWDKIQIAVSPLTKEKVYVVTPQPKINTSTESWKNSNISTTFSINILPMRNASELNDVRIVLSEWPHLINNLATTTTTSTTRPRTSRHPLFGLMDLSSYAPPENATIQTYSGHSKVINAASSSTKKKPSGVEEKATIKTTTQKILT